MKVLKPKSVLNISALLVQISFVNCSRNLCASLSKNSDKIDEMPQPRSTPLIRHDGLKINYDPYAPEMVAKYGAPGSTDNEGFDPYSDSVGPGIYGGRVKRDESGEIVIGRQYQVRFKKSPSSLQILTLRFIGSQFQTRTCLCWRRIHSYV